MTFTNWTLEQERDEGVAFMLAHRGVSVALVRGATTLSAQTVLIAPDANMRSEETSPTGQSSGVWVVLVGAAALDIRRGDRFKYPASSANLNYEVVAVDRSMGGMVQARAKVTQ